MWRQRPPTPVAVLAARVGVDRSTLVNWLTTDRQPQPLQLLVLAQFTDLPLTELTRAVGVPTERIVRQRDALWDYVEWEIRRSHGMPADKDLEAFLERLSAERLLAAGAMQREEDVAARSNDDEEA
jgi:transcriptional regulator with XRE-family HTH domain